MKRLASRPEVSIENYPEVFEYYDHRGPNKSFAKVAHFALSQIFRPHVFFGRGAEEQIDAEVRDGTQLLLVSNHTKSETDQYNLATAVQRVPTLRNRRGNFTIMGKQSLFNQPGIVGLAQRYAIDALGAYPVVRAKDGEEISEDLAEARVEASVLSRRLGVNKAVRDRLDVAGFPEGERLQEGQHHHKVRELKSGFQQIHSELIGNRRVAVLSVGLFIGDEDLGYDTKHADMVFGMPLITDTADPGEFNEMLHANMQRDLSHAVDIRYSRRYANPVG